METKKVVKIVIFSIIGVLVLVTLLSSFTTVETGCVGVKTRFGQVQNDVIQEGLNLKTPYIESIVKIDCKTKKLEIDGNGSTKDMQNCTISVAVNYNVIKDTANTLYKEVGINYEEVIIEPAINESVKSTMAQYTAEQLITKRGDVSNHIEDAIKDKIEKRGFSVTEFNITNIDFSQEYDQAIEQKAVKQQEVATARAELEKQKIQNEKEISIAEKDAKVMKAQNREITDKTLRLKELEIKQKQIEKWDGKFPTTMLSNAVSSLFSVGK